MPHMRSCTPRIFPYAHVAATVRQVAQQLHQLTTQNASCCENDVRNDFVNTYGVKYFNKLVVYVNCIVVSGSDFKI